MRGVSAKVLYRRFSGIREALGAAGLKASGAGFAQTELVLLLDWAEVARKLKRAPSASEYQRLGRFTHKPFFTRYGSWSGVAEAFCRFMRQRENRKLRRRWHEVLKIAGAAARARSARRVGQLNPARAGAVRVEAKQALRRALDDAEEVRLEEMWRWGGGKRRRRGKVFCDRPVYGRPLNLAEMAFAPTNEMGVMFAFAAVARKLGFKVLRIQAACPDCYAMREVAPGVWQRVRIEFEFESRNFLKHRHRKERCDIIVCWKHNWAACPEEIEVIELGRIID
jgi:hypothetical protein